jgi:hypothetical protein
MIEFVNSVTEAQKKLHADMRRDTDMRWSLLPVEDNTIKVSWWRRIWKWCLSGRV